MEDLNVFKIHSDPWKYPANWIRNVRLFGRKCKWAYQRVTRGFCDYDAYDLDSYYLTLFYKTITHLADVTHGYPGDEEFPTPEAWDKYLRELAQYFYRANESNNYYPTPAEAAWWEEVKDLKEPWHHNSPATNAMIKETTDNYKLRRKDMEEGLDKLKHVFFNLWD